MKIIELISVKTKRHRPIVEVTLLQPKIDYPRKKSKQFKEIKLMALVDTGASRTLVRKETLEKINAFFDGKIARISSVSAHSPNILYSFFRFCLSSVIRKSGEHSVPLYDIRIHIPDVGTYQTRVGGVYLPRNKEKFDVCLGWDILQHLGFCNFGPKGVFCICDGIKCQVAGHIEDYLGNKRK